MGSLTDRYWTVLAQLLSTHRELHAITVYIDDVRTRIHYCPDKCRP